MTPVAKASTQKAVIAMSDFRSLRQVERVATSETTNDSMETYLKKVRQTNLLEDEEMRVIRASVAGDSQAKERLMKANLRLVVSIAKSFSGQGLELIDLVHEGNKGLQKAINRFSPSKGRSFESYASWWIREAMTRALSNKSRTVAVVDHHESLTQSELFDVTDNITANRIVSVLNGDGTTQLISHEEMRREMNSLLALLSECERDVIKLRFGLSNKKNPLSSQEVASKLNLSNAQVCKISRTAMRKLRNAILEIESNFVGFLA